jgi:transcriptional regulator with PAS, ATPase and Fis domain
MPRSRSQHDLARLLDNSSTPIYAVEEQGRLAFLNTATADWAGLSTQDLRGQVCRYHSGTELPAPEAAACRLCPPPVAMTGVETSAEIALPSADGRLVRRMVRFIPVRAADGEVIAVLALAGEELPDDSPPASVPGESDSAAMLHERIARLRHRFRQRYELDRVLGHSPAIQRVRTQIALAATSRANVLIVGPVGSGREHVARAIHSTGPHAAGEPLVPLACALVGGELLRSTVAALLQDAGRSDATLLLNDIDQLAPEFQADLPSLLSAVEDKVRVLSTSRAPLLELVARGEFLSLAAYQLSTMVIELPPLAERLSDLPLLAQLFLEQVNARGSKQVARFSDEALDLLAAYPWTNDLDELEQVVVQSHHECQGVEIRAADLPAIVRQARGATAHPPRPEETIDLEEFLARIELELIQRALSRAKGNKTKAAQLLGLNRPRLYRRLVQLGLAEENAAGEAEEAFKELPPDET